MPKVILYATLKAAPGQEAFVTKALTDLAQGSRTEPGNIRFEVYQRDDGVYHLEESYKDEAAIEAHKVTEHRKTFDAIVPGKLDGGLNVVFLKPVSTSD